MEITETTKKHVYNVVIVVFISISVIFFFVSEEFFNQQDQVIETGKIAPDCNLQQAPCVATFSGNEKITFAITPTPIKPLVPLELLVKVENIQPQQVFVNFEGIDMYMGFYRPELAKQNNAEHDLTGNYQGSATLSVCTLDKMQWQATVILATPRGNYIAPFTFTVDQ